MTEQVRQNVEVDDVLHVHLVAVQLLSQNNQRLMVLVAFVRVEYIWFEVIPWQVWRKSYLESSRASASNTIRFMFSASLESFRCANGSE